MERKPTYETIEKSEENRNSKNSIIGGSAFNPVGRHTEPRLACEQLAILEASGDSRAVDELALDYDDTCWIITEAESQNALTQDELSALQSLGPTTRPNEWRSECQKLDGRSPAVLRLLERGE